MRFRTYRALVRSDLHRVAGRGGFCAFVNMMRWNPGFHYCFWLRTVSFWEGGRSFASRLLARAGRGVLFRRSLRFGIEIPPQTRVGPGLYIGHFGGIVVHPDVVIGSNCNLSQGVTLGRANRGARAGCPRIGNDVYIGPGAKVFGAIRVGNRAAIGANAVVTGDVPEGVSVAGVPARPLSDAGSDGYINRTDYPPVEGWPD